MTDSDRAYHLSRVDAEHLAVNKATCAVARRRHIELAELHAGRARADLDLLVDRLGMVSRPRGATVRSSLVSG